MTTEFTVRGMDRAFAPPERGTAHVTISFEGPAPQPVHDRVVADLAALTASIKELHDPERGPVTWWSTQQLRTWANRPWNSDGKQLPLVHHASVSVQAKFGDSERLGAWISHHATRTSGFRLDGVAWALTEARRLDLERQVRTRAVRQALRRAQEYADALELGQVRPVAIADAGLLIPEAGSAPGGAPFMRMAAAKESGGELELAPEDIELSAEVHARFVAG